MTATATFSVATAATIALVAEYNRCAEALGRKTVARFADRKTAERRTAAIIAEFEGSDAFAAASAAVVAKHAQKADAFVASIAQLVKTTPAKWDGESCPSCGVSADQTAGRVVESGGRQEMRDEHIGQCHHCGHTYNLNTGKAARFSNERAQGDSSAAIAASWADAEVRAARLQRTSVTVSRDGKVLGTFASLKKAALATGFRFSIKARLDLKAAGELVIDGFRVVVAETRQL